ncbi:MAG: DNA helicase RecQ [Eubacteriales bacterium]
MDKNTILSQYFGYYRFREGQAELIDNILDGRDVLGIMPTGSGKSLCFQIPALMLKGITLVVSPLISLMKDQVNALVQAGVHAAYLNSSLTPGQQNEVLRRAANLQYQIIYIAPERLVSDAFIQFAEATSIAMVTVDEAHCVSQWGQDFRPNYLKIVNFIERLSYRPVISSFTATATQEVRDDIISILKLKNPFVITTGFDRENLSYRVIKPADKFHSLLGIAKNNSGKSGIVYCSTRKTVEEVCARLNESGYPATRYHAGLPDEERFENQDDFIFDRSKVMVATNAFGMGIDKSNVSYVVHYNMPKSIESYYQEAGRAGRDGEPAECVLLYSGQDVRTNLFLIENNQDNSGDLSEEMREAVRQKDRDRLRSMTFYCSTTDCLRQYILQYFGEKSQNYCGNCSNCNTHFETMDITSEARKIIVCVSQLTQIRRSFGKNMIADILHGSKNEKVLRFHLDALSSHGGLSDISIHRIRTILDYLIENEYLCLTSDEFPVVTLTDRSDEITQDLEPLSMKLPEETKPCSPSRKKSSDVPQNSGLFDLLKNLRTRLAAASHVPAYIIFTDASLKDMCKKLPDTIEEFLEVSGVGDSKAKKYGKVFTEMIGEYVNKA